MIRLDQSTSPQVTSSRIRGGRLVVWAALVCVATARPVRADGGDVSGSRDTPSARRVAFARDIRPILADKCFRCHGPDTKQRKGKLRLDNRRDATAPAASGDAAIVPGKLEESELYRRITAEDADERMPPAQSGNS